MLADVMGGRTERPMLIVDIAMPRDVDPAAGDIDNVTLLDMEDLTAFAEVGRAERRGEIVAVRSLIDEEVVRFNNTAASRKVEPLVKLFRNEVESLRTAEVDRRAGDVDEATLAEIDAASRALLNKLLHSPMAALRNTAGTAKGERLAEALQELFDLDLDQ